LTGVTFRFVALWPLQFYSFEQWHRAFDRIEAGKVQNCFVDVRTVTEVAAFSTHGSVVEETKKVPDTLLCSSFCIDIEPTPFLI